MNFFRNLPLVTALSLCGCATTHQLPDLTVTRLDASPAETTAGSSLSLRSAIRNAGDAPTAAPAELDIRIFADPGAQSPVADLTAWGQPEGSALGPGETVEDQANIRTPALQPGSYSICATADPDNSVEESLEGNNRACIPITIIPGAPRRADLVIEKVTAIGTDQASLKVKLKIRNAGSDTAGPFRIMAFRRNPRQPLLLIECPLTEGQLSAGSPASCDDLTRREPLAAGASTEITGYFAYVVANGASFIRNPIGPGNPNPPVRRTIDFMVDGCFPPEDGSPVYCAVDEIDEINNFKGKTLYVR